jgi:ATP synthase protein I
MTEMIARGAAYNGFDDDAEDPPVKALTRDEAQALRATHPLVSPWRVVAMQAAVGVGMTALVWLVSSHPEVMWSVLYGAATVVVPGALMARGVAGGRIHLSPTASAVSVMMWSMLKIGVAVLMLLLAPKVLQPLSWPALLAAMVVCMQMYWFALLWRGR